MPTEEAEARFDESLAVILEAWSSDEPFSHKGRFWHYHEMVVLFLDRFTSTKAIGERIALFKAECEARGRAVDPMDVAVVPNLHVARDADDASAALLGRRPKPANPAVSGAPSQFCVAIQ